MRPTVILTLALAALAIGACGDDAATATDTATDTTATDTVATDTTPDTGTDTATEVIDPTTVPMIGEGLTCGTRAEVGGVPRGTELARHDIDLGVFPDALCNDGTGARFYVRPYVGEANRNRWVIQLKGGGGCASGADCAKRWCSVLTNFGKTQMTADINAPQLDTIAGNGILERRDDNPWGNYNQVFVQYCSSDEWAGSAKDRVVQTFAPCDPEVAGAKCPDGSACPGEAAGKDAGLCKNSPVSFRIHFLGHAIVDAVVATLRQDGVGAVGAGAGGTALPDLDDAEYVVLAGASGGGAGVVNNLDRLSALLADHNSRCQTDGTCPLEVDGLIDSIFSPTFEGLDFAATPVCIEAQACDYASAMTLSLESEANFTSAVRDASCKAWHAAHAPGTEWRCMDRNHVIRNHLTTPFFVRQGLVDSLLTKSFIDFHLGAAGEPTDLIDTPLEVAKLVQPQLASLADWPTRAEEGSPDAIAPGAFGPGCPKHETLSSSPDIYDTTITFAGAPRAMFEVIAFWKAGGANAVLVAKDPSDSFCAPAEP